MEDPDSRLMLHPKPAYWGFRNAMTNYFGRAFSVKDSSGLEIFRMVENGNVLLMAIDAQVHEEQTSTQLETAAASGQCFIVKDAAGDPKAVLTPEGDLYLAGKVFERQGKPLNPATGHNAFKIANADGETVAFISDTGNLKMTGYLLEYGIPYSLRTYSGDGYRVA